MVATSAQIRAALVDVFTDSTITAFTSLAYDYDLIGLVSAEIASTHNARMYDDNEINFIQYLVKRSEEALATDKAYQHIIDITYTKEVDDLGANYNSVSDFYETLVTTMNSVLSFNFNGLVSNYIPQTETPDVILTQLEDKDVYQANYQFIAFS